MFGNSKVVEVLLEHGADPNIRDKYGATPLHYAAALDYPKIVELLHKKDLSDYDATPLQAAAEFNYPEVAELLLEHGANPNIQDNDGDTPLHLAALRDYCEVVKLLLDHGADPTIRDNEGRTPLDYGSDCEEIIEEFMRGGSRTTVYE
jgi:ankyrin repeat protein